MVMRGSGASGEASPLESGILNLEKLQKTRAMKPNDDEEEIRPLYQKVGKRYKAVGVDLDTNLIKTGHWHLHVETDGHSILCLRRKITPDYLAFSAAMKEFMDTVIEMMWLNSKMRIGRRMPKHVEMAFAKLKSELGDDLPTYFEYSTIEEIVGDAMLYMEEKCK